MKVTNWCKNLRATLLAAGFWIPTAVYAQNIPLGDPSFEDYVVPAPPGYAYAADPNGAYRPTSAWIDDLDGPGGSIQDDAGSNWIYDAAYAETNPALLRPAPRTGNQAMHGIAHYNAQVTDAVFEAEKTYSFSVWAQGDSDSTGDSSRVWLYVFDGSIPFSEANSLSFARYAPDTLDFANRTPGSTPAQSQAMWTQIHLRHSVLPGAPEIGNPIGVAFWGADDNAVDDATLRADPIQDFLMFLEVNTTNGQVVIKNQTGETLNIDYYEITSAADSLNATAWNSFQEQNLPGFPAGDGSGNGWEAADASGAGVVSESYLTGNSGVSHGATVGLGAAFNAAVGAHDLVFRYSVVPGSGGELEGDYNDNGAVDAADYTLWRDTLGQDVTAGSGADGDGDGSIDPGDYTVWKSNFGNSAGPSGAGELLTGFVRYVGGAAAASAVPEPSTIILVGIGLASLAIGGMRGGRDREKCRGIRKNSD